MYNFSKKARGFIQLLLLMILYFDKTYGDEKSAVDVFNAIQNPENDEITENNLNIHCYNTAKIVALNKITAKSKEFEIAIGETVTFGNIQITVHKYCKSPDIYSSTYYALLTITEHKIDDDPKVVFQGWLVSFNPSLSTFEHPIYEVFVHNLSLDAH